MKCKGLGAPGVSLGYLGEKSRSEERQGCESSTARPYVSARPRYTLQCPPLGRRAARGLSTSRGRRCPVSPGKRAPGWKPWMRGANGVVSPRSVKVLEVEAGALAAGLPAVRMCASGRCPAAMLGTAPAAGERPPSPPGKVSARPRVSPQSQHGCVWPARAADLVETVCSLPAFFFFSL